MPIDCLFVVLKAEPSHLGQTLVDREPIALPWGIPPVLPDNETAA